MTETTKPTKSPSSRLAQRNYAVALALLALVALFFLITVTKIRQGVELRLRAENALATEKLTTGNTSGAP